MTFSSSDSAHLNSPVTDCFNLVLLAVDCVNPTTTVSQINLLFVSGNSARGLTFTWWGCYGLCLTHKPTELAHSFYSVLVSVSVFMALSTVFHSMNSPYNSPLSHTVLRLTPALLVLSTIYLFV